MKYAPYLGLNLGHLADESNLNNYKNLLYTNARSFDNVINFFFYQKFIFFFQNFLLGKGYIGTTVHNTHMY